MLDQADMWKEENTPKEENASSQRPPQEKLILPGPPGASAEPGEPVMPGGASTEEYSLHSRKQSTKVLPEHLIRPEKWLPPKQPLAKLVFFWGKDPAYKVLMIGVALVMVVGLVSLTLLSRTFLRDFNVFAQSNTLSQDQVVTIATGTIDLNPTFAPPGGGKGSSSSSQPPAQTTPTLQQTATPTTPTPTPTPSGTLTVQITNIPSVVMNNTKVLVGVTTSGPGVSVSLVISYNAPPYKASTGSRITDDNGNASIPWHVHVYSVKPHTIIATVTAIAVDQNGQKVYSTPVVVQIIAIGD